MNGRLTAAQAALRAGKGSEAIELLTAALSANPALPADTWLTLGRELYHAGRLAEARTWMARAVAQHPAAHKLWNILGVVFRVLKQPAAALDALDRSIAREPGEIGAQINRANVLIDMGQGDAAAKQLRTVLAMDPAYEAGWLQLAGLAGPPDAALRVLDEGLAGNPKAVKLLAGRALVLRNAGRLADLRRWLEEVVRRVPDAAWPHFDLGDLLVQTDLERGIAELRQALELEPSLNHRVGLARALAMKNGADEAAALEEAWLLCREALTAGGFQPDQALVMRGVFARVAALEEIAALGDAADLGRDSVASGNAAALLWKMATVDTKADRLDLLEAHRLWGEQAQRQAEKNPVRRAPLRRPRGKLRLGLLSSDLRNHAVARYALPLFDHLDRDRWELYAYSFYRGEEDSVQAQLSSQATAYRWWPEMSPVEAAQRIADDQLDMLIDLGGPTAMNKPQVMAWRPAPIQASWLGYPHSLGLDGIDYFICDRHNAPTDPGLLIERLLMMPDSWVPLAHGYGVQPIVEGLPEERTGFITFGTANAPYKYNTENLAAWARIVAAVPGSHFAFVRPEAASPAFRANIIACFAAQGVDARRIIFRPAWGQHMPLYNEIDISLDTFPLTGGVTTADSLWMGVPVVSLAGPAFFERMSRSLLINAGLAELCADSVDDYVAAAIGLAANRPRRGDLRRNLRAQIGASRFGRPEVFARDFYDLMAATVAGHRGL